MSVTELLPNLQRLSRADKFRVMQFLVLELSKEEMESSSEVFQPEAVCPTWSSYDNHEAAHKLMQLLEEDKLLTSQSNA